MSSLKRGILAPLIFLLGLFCRLVCLATGLALLTIGLAVLWWMSSGYIGFETIQTIIGEETFQVHLQPGPMLPLPWHFDSWSDWFWGIFRFGFLLLVVMYATIATMFIGGMKFLIFIPNIPYQNQPGELYNWVEDDDQQGGLQLAFTPVLLLVGTMAGTALINMATLTVAMFWIGEVPAGNDWEMAMAIQTELPYLGAVALLVFIGLYAYSYLLMSWIAAIGIAIVVAVRVIAWPLGWFGITDPDVVFLIVASPPYLVACLGSIAALFVDNSNSR